MTRFITVLTIALAALVIPIASRADDQTAAAATTSAGYRIHAGDELTVTIFGDAQPSGPPQPIVVLTGGVITLPLVGPVNVGGQSPEQASITVAKALSKYYRHPIVTVAVTKQGPLNVIVLGNVKNPNKYALQPQSRLADAIAAAGGLGVTDGDYPVARLQSVDGSVREISLQKFLHDGDTALNVPLDDQTTIFIPSPLTINVEVLGAVDHPGDVIAHEGERLSMVIARAGTSQNSTADLNHVTVTRKTTDGTAQTHQVDLYKILKQGDLSQDMLMEKGDLVFVPTANHKDTVSGPASVFNVLRVLLGLP